MSRRQSDKYCWLYKCKKICTVLFEKPECGFVIAFKNEIIMCNASLFGNQSSIENVSCSVCSL